MEFFKKLMGIKPKRKVYQPHELPTIIVETPQGLQVSIDTMYDESRDLFDETDCKPTNQEETPTKPSRIRRNSISLPNLDDLEEQVFGIQDEEISISNNRFSSTEPSDDEEFQFDFEKPLEKRVPLRNVRRKSVTSAVPKMLKPGELDSSGGYSPGTSITSVNSLASLLKEKIQNLPSQIRKKKPKEYKIRAFVGFLFIAIVFLVGFAYVLYQQKLLQKAYFDKIKFNKAKREIKFFNNDGVNIIKGNLGTTLPNNKIFPCLPQNTRNDDSICLEWMDGARLYIDLFQMNPETRCYNFQWISLNEKVEPTDCFDLVPGEYWYGGGQNQDVSWPLNKLNHDFVPFITGSIEKHQWGNVLKRYFINSRGVAIFISDSAPLYISIKNSTGLIKQFCLKAKYDDFAYFNKITSYPTLNYSICTAPNTTILHSNLSKKDNWDGLKPFEDEIIDSLLTEPLWEVPSTSKSEFNEETLSTYTQNIMNLGFLKQGHVLVNEFWQKEIGDFALDVERFANFENMMEALHRRGVRLVVSIQPFISTESLNFAETVRKRLLISERGSDGKIPALTRYKSLESAAVLDITNKNTSPWLIEKLKFLMEKHKFSTFFIDFGTAYNIPHYYQTEMDLFNPDQYKTLFINSLQDTVSIFGVNSAVQEPKVPIFVSLPPFQSSWEGLRRVIPTVLTYGLIGYHYLIPGAVGGDYEASFTTKTKQNVTGINIELPDKELYMRWLQLATFLPVMRFTYLPSYYSDEKVLEMAKVMASIRQVTITPLLKKYVKETLRHGLPLIRPLWMLQPNDPACHAVSDEFAIGDELIVAPVLHSGARQREVYLPAGVWMDGIDSSKRKGNRWIHDYKVEEDKIAYFRKMPDDTRL
nr:uncharacterized family 31 glucosidase KIAA1161 isoform X2 [Onthophagus taurus]